MQAAELLFELFQLGREHGGEFQAVKLINKKGIINVGGTGNAAPTGQGITDKNTLISRGWTVTTN